MQNSGPAPSPPLPQDTVSPQGASKQIKIMMLMNKNPFYAAPEAELLVVRFEEGILNVSTQQNTIKSATIDEWDEEL